MLTWVLIGLLVVGVIIFIKMSHYRHRIFVITIVIVALFLYISVAYVASKNDLDFNSYDGLVKSVKIYGGWLFNLAGNFKGLTGSAIGMDWTATNASMSDLSLDSPSVDGNSKPSKITASARFATKK